MRASVTRRSTLRRWLAVALAVVMLFLASWIVVPAPTYFLLTFGVGAPEVSAWLAVGSVLAAALALPGVRTAILDRVALACSVVALGLSLVPLAQVPATARRFDAAMRAASGGDPLRVVPADTRRAMRPDPVVVADLFRGVRLDSTTVVRGVPVGAPGGVHLTVDVYRPARAGRFPVVVQIYGGAWQRGAPGSNADFAQWIAARGYVVFAVDYRHAPGARWPAQLDDVHLAETWIAAHAADYGADASRVILIGRSAGGQLALLAAYTPSPLGVRGVVSYYGPTDLVDAYRHPPRPDPLRIRSVEETLFGGTPDELPSRYREASPVTYATRPLPPTLLIYGGRDHTVEPRYGARLHERLTASGTTSVFLEIPWAEHAFDAVLNGPSSQLALYHTERFLAWAMRK